MATVRQSSFGGSKLDGTHCLVYIDDIIVFSKTFEEHIYALSLVFDRLEKYGVKLKPKKCSFFQLEVEYLGYLVSGDGVRPCPDKVDKVLQSNSPMNVKQIRSFLGLVTYYARFVESLSTLAAPMRRLLKKDVPWSWGPKQEQSFNEIKLALTRAPVLAFPDFEKPFELHTDASNEGIGATLVQKDEQGNERVIAYYSRALNEHEKNYHTHLLEALAVVAACRKFRIYLLYKHFDIYTDHISSSRFKRTTNPDAKMIRWSIYLSEFNFTIHHRKGTDNSDGDALSRSPIVHASTMEFFEQLHYDHDANWPEYAYHDFEPIHHDRNAQIFPFHAMTFERVPKESLKMFFLQRNDKELQQMISFLQRPEAFENFKHVDRIREVFLAGTRKGHCRICQDLPSMSNWQDLATTPSRRAHANYHGDETLRSHFGGSNRPTAPNGARKPLRSHFGRLFHSFCHRYSDTQREIADSCSENQKARYHKVHGTLDFHHRQGDGIRRSYTWFDAPLQHGSQANGRLSPTSQRAGRTVQSHDRTDGQDVR